MTFEDIKNIAIMLNQIASQCGYFVGLTGGYLYKYGDRKELDFVVYGKRPLKQNKDLFISILQSLEGFSNIRDYGFVVKVQFNDKDIDLLFVNDALHSSHDYTKTL